MGYRVAISPLIINTTSLLPHQGCSPLDNAGTEMGEGPRLLAGNGKIWASKSRRTIPPGSLGSLGKSSTASNRSSLVPHGWKKLALTLSSFSSEICHLISSRKKKPSNKTTKTNPAALLLLLLFTLRFCCFPYPL